MTNFNSKDQMIATDKSYICRHLPSRPVQPFHPISVTSWMPARGGTSENEKASSQSGRNRSIERMTSAQGASGSILRTGTRTRRRKSLYRARTFVSSWILFKVLRLRPLKIYTAPWHVSRLAPIPAKEVRAGFSTGACRVGASGRMILLQHADNNTLQ
jgi:hypothetical protein